MVEWRCSAMKEAVAWVASGGVWWTVGGWVGARWLGHLSGRGCGGGSTGVGVWLHGTGWRLRLLSEWLMRRWGGLTTNNLLYCNSFLLFSFYNLSMSLW